MARHRALIKALGCKVNQCDAEAVSSELRAAGFDIVGDSDAHGSSDASADVCVVFTCSVTAEGDRKSRQMIRHLIREHPNALMVAASCYAEIRPEELRAIPDVDLVIGTSEMETLAPRICETLDLSRAESDHVATAKSCRRTRAFVKIQDGCDQFCSYCQIPLTRGLPRSRDIWEILQEVRVFVEHGHPEVVLCGIRLGAFGMETGRPEALPDLLRELDLLPGLVRYRLSSIEPNDFGEPLLAALPKLQRLAPHFHIPLQSGSDFILQRMNRRYATQHYQSLIERLQSEIPKLAISTDVLVGFPGETEEQAQETEDFLARMCFSKVHLFPFSPRPDTAAAKMKPRVASDEVRRRKKSLEEIAIRGACQFRQRFIGASLSVLIEGKGFVSPKTGERFLTGFSENYLRVAIASTRALPLRQGRVYDTVITRLDRDTLIGDVPRAS